MFSRQLAAEFSLSPSTQVIEERLSGGFRVSQGCAGSGSEGWSGVVGEDEGFQIEVGAGDPGVDADGGLAASLKQGEEVALCGNAGEGFGVVQGGKRGGEFRGFLIGFEGDGSLAGGGEEVFRIENGEMERGGVIGEDFLVETKAEEAGPREDEGVDGGIPGGFAQAGGNIAADFDRLQIRADMAEESDAADAAGSDGAAGR